MRVLLTRIATEKALPFEVEVPNPTTVAAIKEAREESLPKFKNVAALMDDLNANDQECTKSQRQRARRPLHTGQGKTKVKGPTLSHGFFRSLGPMRQWRIDAGFTIGVFPTG